MTNKELMEVLQSCDQNAKVFIRFPPDYQYVSLRDEMVYHIPGETGENMVIIVVHKD